MRALAPVLALLLACCGDVERPDPSWVEIYDPAASEPGYNLVLFQRRTPVLIDMNGNEVHRWPGKASGRARLLPDGGLLMIGVDDAVRQLDWEGRKTWEHRLPGEDFAHHDLLLLANGNRLILAHDVAARLDYLLEVDDAGDVVWEWRAQRHLAADLEQARQALGPDAANANLTHVNSVHELPANHWFDGGDQRFRPGNILISARNLDTLYVLDRATGEVVWSYQEGLDRQHEATMIPSGFPGEGNIVVFNNGLRNRFVYRRSSVVEIDPVAGREVWSYRAPNFFSSTGGTQQSLANGNLLVTSSRGGRLFELARDGRIVWQWTPPYLPMREHRYPYDFCPQLARLERPRPRRVEASARRHVDRDLYDFTIGVPMRRIRIDDRDVRLLASANVCSEVVLPERAELTVGYGFEKPGDEAKPAIPAILATVRATPRVESTDVAATRVLFQNELRSGRNGVEPGSIEQAKIDLSALALESVEICFAAEAAGGGAPDGAFFWTRPTIRSAARADAETAAPEAAGALQEKKLKALGYVD